MLRLRGHSIINLKEFKEYADFWQIYAQRNEFLEFANVHCLPIQLLDDVDKPVQYLNKSFWIELLKWIENQDKKKKDLGNICDYEEYITNICIRFYEREKRRCQILEHTMCHIVPEEPSLWNEYVEQAIQKFLAESYGTVPEEEIEEIRTELKEPFKADTTYIKAVKEEARNLSISNHIKTIQKYISSEKEIEKMTLIVLCVSMLTEVEVEKLNLSNSKKAELSEKYLRSTGTFEQIATVRKQAETSQKYSKSVNLSEKIQLCVLPKRNGIKAIRKETEYLSCRKEPYIWLLDEEESLSAGQLIQSVKIEAVSGKNERVMIHLFSAKSKSVVSKMELKAGEYRYCNITDNGVIGFLPIVSVCEEKRIYRPYKNKEDLHFQSEDGQILVLKYGMEVTCFSVSLQGELYLRKGKTIYNSSINNEQIKRKLDEISYEEFVEVKLLKEGFLLLTNRGVICSNLPKWNGRKAISLAKL